MEADARPSLADMTNRRAGARVEDKEVDDMVVRTPGKRDHPSHPNFHRVVASDAG